MKVLVVKLSSMGDVLHALPTAAAIKRQTRAELHWAVHPAFSGLVRCFRCVDRIVEIPRHADFSTHMRAFRILRETAYDRVFDLQGLFKSAVVTRLARLAPGGRRIGPPFHREGSGLVYHAAPKLVRPRRHAVEECLDVLEAAGLERPEVPEFALDPPDVAVGAGKAFRVAVAPVSRWETKNWPVERFAEAIRILHREHGAEIHIVGGPADAECVEALVRLASVPVKDHSGMFDVPHSCGLLRHMDCLVTNDSGPMHLAAAVGTRCVAIFGPTDPGRTGPYGPGHIVLRSGDCPPCHRRVCRKPSRLCMEAVEPEAVVAAVMAGKPEN